MHFDLCNSFGMSKYSLSEVEYLYKHTLLSVPGTMPIILVFPDQCVILFFLLPLPPVEPLN